MRRGAGATFWNAVSHLLSAAILLFILVSPATAQSATPDLGVEVVAPNEAVTGNTITFPVKVTNHGKAPLKSQAVVILVHLDNGNAPNDLTLTSAAWNAPASKYKQCQLLPPGTGSLALCQDNLQASDEWASGATRELLVQTKVNVPASKPLGICAKYATPNADPNSQNNQDCRFINVVTTPSKYDLTVTIAPVMPAGKSYWYLGSKHEVLVTVQTVPGTSPVLPGVEIIAAASFPWEHAYFNLPKSQQSPTTIPSVTGPTVWNCIWDVLGKAFALCKLKVGPGGFTSGSFKVPVTPIMNGGQLNGSASVGFTPPIVDVNLQNDKANAAAITVLGVNLAVQKSLATPSPWKTGTKQSFKIFLHDAGVPVDRSWIDKSKKIRIRDVLEAAFAFHSAGAPWSCAKDTSPQDIVCDWAIPSGSGPLGPIDDLVITVNVVGAGTVVANNQLQASNTATMMQGPQVSFPSIPGKTFGDAVWQDNSSTITIAAPSPYDISVGKSVDKAAWTQGETHKFSVVVTNNSKDSLGTAIAIPPGVGIEVLDSFKHTVFKSTAGKTGKIMQLVNTPNWTCANYSPSFKDPPLSVDASMLKCTRSPAIAMPPGPETLTFETKAPKIGDLIGMLYTETWQAGVLTQKNCAWGQLTPLNLKLDIDPSNDGKNGTACATVTIAP